VLADPEENLFCAIYGHPTRANRRRADRASARAGQSPCDRTPASPTVVTKAKIKLNDTSRAECQFGLRAEGHRSTGRPSN
jgi:hypothetical protein